MVRMTLRSRAETRPAGESGGDGAQTAVLLKDAAAGLLRQKVLFNRRRPEGVRGPAVCNRGKSKSPSLSSVCLSVCLPAAPCISVYHTHAWTLSRSFSRFPPGKADLFRSWSTG